jgi:methylated-DNA-[protein]-cysteine S-methyltransferase
MPPRDEPNNLVVFRSSLGWMALIGAGRTLRQLTFAHRTARAAVEACDSRLLATARRGTWNEPLIRRLQAYATGSRVEFTDVQIDLEPLGPFPKRVIHQCRQIPYGQTLSYGQLAAKAGSPAAARAVGNCMAANRVPLIVPCHRVLRADGSLGAYSAPGGSRTKRRLLALEGIRLD